MTWRNYPTFRTAIETKIYFFWLKKLCKKEYYLCYSIELWRASVGLWFFRRALPWIHRVGELEAPLRPPTEKHGTFVGKIGVMGQSFVKESEGSQFKPPTRHSAGLRDPNSLWGPSDLQVKNWGQAAIIGWSKAVPSIMANSWS